jgi:hypothetical protein
MLPGEPLDFPEKLAASDWQAEYHWDAKALQFKFPCKCFPLHNKRALQQYLSPSSKSLHESSEPLSEAD